MLYWILLAFAIISEVIGTLSMKWASVNDATHGYIVMLFMISISYILLSFAMKRISMGVAYAIWEGIGILLITLFSVLFFNESLSIIKLLGIVVLITGIVFIKSNSVNPKESNHASA